MVRNKARWPIAVLPLWAAACSSAGSYPSLALRDVERSGGQAMPVAGQTTAAPPALPSPNADLATRLDGLVAVARAAERQFQSQRPGTERAVAAAGAKASDSWSIADVALAELESSRSQAMVAFAELETLYVDTRSAAATEESPDAKAIAGARNQVSDWIAEQNKVIAELSTRLRS